jgi:hypothetical protein
VRVLAKPASSLHRAPRRLREERHLPFFEEPALFIQVIEDFLR